MVLLKTCCVLLMLSFVNSELYITQKLNAKDDIPAACVAHGEPPEAVNVACAAAGDDALIPHGTDCELFYYCVPEGAPVCRACPPGLHFSPTEHVCDHPDHAGCRIVDQTSTTGASTT